MWENKLQNPRRGERGGRVSRSDRSPLSLSLGTPDVPIASPLPRFSFLPCGAQRAEAEGPESCQPAPPPQPLELGEQLVASLFTWRLTGPDCLSETLGCPSQERLIDVGARAWCGVWRPGVSSQQYNKTLVNTSLSSNLCLLELT